MCDPLHPRGRSERHPAHAPSARDPPSWRCGMDVRIVDRDPTGPLRSAARSPTPRPWLSDPPPPPPPSLAQQIPVLDGFLCVGGGGAPAGVGAAARTCVLCLAPARCCIGFAGPL